MCTCLSVEPMNLWGQKLFMQTSLFRSISMKNSILFSKYELLKPLGVIHKRRRLTMGGRGVDQKAI